MDKKTLVGIAIILGIILIIIGGMAAWMAASTFAKGLILVTIGGVILWVAARVASVMEV